MTTPGGHLLAAYSGGKTSGVICWADRETFLLSGIEGPSQGTTGIPGMHNRIKTHVEAHAAALMRRLRIPEATLFINRVPCPTKDPRSPGCYENLPKMLPEDSRLRVVGPDGFDEIFVGLPDPLRNAISGL